MTPEDIIAYAIEHTPQANAVIAALAAKGYRIMPKELTREMVVAAHNDGRRGSIQDIYAALLESAPPVMSHSEQADESEPEGHPS